MDQKPKTPARKPILWNWADPSGYGVPGKPITQDQFYTEDVFYMLVPADGYGSDAFATMAADYKGPRFRQPDPPLQEGEDVGNWGPRHDPGIFVDPGSGTYDPTSDPWGPRHDPGIFVDPGSGTYDPTSDSWCATTAKAAYNNYLSIVSELEEGRKGLASASTPKEKEDWISFLAPLEAALPFARASYERALKCRGQTAT